MKRLLDAGAGFGKLLNDEVARNSDQQPASGIGVAQKLKRPGRLAMTVRSLEAGIVPKFATLPRQKLWFHSEARKAGP